MYFRFIVREFSYDEETIAAGKNELTKLMNDKKKHYVSTPFGMLLFNFVYLGKKKKTEDFRFLASCRFSRLCFSISV